MMYIKLSTGHLINLKSLDSLSPVFMMYGDKFVFNASIRGREHSYCYPREVDAIKDYEYIIHKINEIGWIYG